MIEAITKAVDILRFYQGYAEPLKAEGILTDYDVQRTVEALAALTALQPSPARDYGKMMKPPADATHCGGYPVSQPAREEAEALVKEYRMYRNSSEAFGPTDDMCDFIAREILGEKT